MEVINSLKENQIKSIIKFQVQVKYNLYFIRKITGYLKLINNNLTSITHNIYYNLYLNNIITKEKYNMYMEKIDIVNNKCNKYLLPINMKIINKYSSENIKNDIKLIIILLFELCEYVAAEKCSDVINLLSKTTEWKNYLIDDYKKLLKFYDKHFICISSKLIENNKKVNNIFSIIKNINNKLPFINKLENKQKIILQIEGATIYFPIKNKLVVINGFFKKDQLNLYRNNELFTDKIRDLEEHDIDIPNKFKNMFLKQISVRDFIILTIPDIIKLINR